MLLLCQSAFSQSKKEQIETLIFQKDSLSSVLEKERQLNSNQVKQLEAKNSNQKDSLTKELKNLGIKVQEISILKDQAQNRIDSLKSELKKITSSYINIEAENAQLQLDVQRAMIFAYENEILKEDGLNFPENNFGALLTRFGNKEKNVAEYNNWLSQIVTNDLNGDPAYVTANCLVYIGDVMDYYWGYDGSIDEKTLKEKWDNQYDLKYSNFGHLFENGNCGWMTKKLTKIEYLGELNNGDWFKLTINGGCGINDYSNTLIRIIKVVKEGNTFYIDNFLSLSDD
jgi:hypothetical protein